MKRVESSRGRNPRARSSVARKRRPTSTGRTTASTRGPARPKRNKKNKSGGLKRAISWKRVGLGTLSGIAALIVGTGVGFGTSSFYEMLVTSKSFAIETIEFKGLEQSDQFTIEGLAGIRKSENIFTINLDSVERGIASHPWIESVEARRVLPRTISVEVKEYEPVLLLALGALYYVDKAGNIVKRYTPGENLPLPLVTGLSREDFEQDELRTRGRLAQVISFINDYKLETGEDAHTIEELHLDPVMGLTFLPSGEKRRVRIGHAPWRQKIRQWERLKDNSEVLRLQVSEVILGGKRRPERVVMRVTGTNTSELGGAR